MLLEKAQMYFFCLTKDKASAGGYLEKDGAPRHQRHLRRGWKTMGLSCVKRSFYIRWETGLKSLPAQGSYSFLRTELAPYPLERSSLPPDSGFMSQTPRVYAQAFLHPHPVLVRSITALRSPGVLRRPFFMLSSCSPHFLSLLTCSCPSTTASSHGIQGEL